MSQRRPQDHLLGKVRQYGHHVGQPRPRLVVLKVRSHLDPVGGLANPLRDGVHFSQRT